MAEGDPEKIPTDDWSADLAAARVENKASARKRRPPVSEAASAQSSDLPPEVLALQAEVDKLLTPENLAALAKLPGAYLHAAKGRKHWEITDQEALQIAVPASTVSRYYGRFDPGKLALAFLAISIATVYGPRWMEDRRLDQEEAKEKAERAAQA